MAPETLWVGWLVKRMAYDGLVDEPAVVTLRDVQPVHRAAGNAGTSGVGFS